MLKRIVMFSLLLATFSRPDLLSQSKVEIKASFYDAESWILFEAYKEALPIYLRLLKFYPNNANYKYRIGQCYINTPGEKEKAVSYLEDAVKKINPKYKEGKFKETGAPYDALYYLANAYRINNQIEKALDTYELFNRNLDSDVYDTAVVNLQIQSCKNAMLLMSRPLYLKEVNLGDLINESKSEFNPVISDNEDILIYSKSEAFYDAILYSTKSNGKWSAPLNMNELLKIDTDLFPTSLSADGKTLYLYSSADYDGIIYTSRFENGTWSPIVKLNENINTKFWESHATISHNNKKLFFTSNRKGTYGGLDIYISERDSTGEWGVAKNLGPAINTRYNEESPFLTNDDKTLFFSSRGHFNIGGYDVFYTTLQSNGEWSGPLNVGYPLNSTDDDVFFNPLKNGYEGYYSRDIPQGFGKEDIYRIEVFSDDHPRKFMIRGVAKIADLMTNARDSVKISAMKITDPDQTLIVYSDPQTGEYEFELPQGSYQLTFEGDGSDKVVKDLELPLTFPADSFVMPGTILPRTDFVAELSVESNKTIAVARGDSVLFPLKTEPGSVLVIEHWVGDSLLSSEQYVVADSVFNYKMVPSDGNNRIVFKLTDKFSNVTTTDVFISKEKEVTEQPVVRPEYSRIISKKQISAMTGMLKSRSDVELAKVISSAKTDQHQFGKIDDLISYLKEEAARKSISNSEVDKLALRVAVMDNILTQAAVDLMAKNATGDLKTILSDLDIYEADIKTWTALQEYVDLKTGGKISPEEMNRIAAAILSDTDPYIAVMREKILVYSETSESGSIIRESVAAVDLKNIRLKDKWLRSFRNESIRRGLTNNQFAEMMVTISSMPGSDVQQFLNDLIGSSEEPLRSNLKSLNIKKEGIKTPRDLIKFLLADKNQDKFPEDAVLKAISNLIASKDIPDNVISEQKTGRDEISRSWIIWIILGSALIFFILYKKPWKKKSKY